MAQSSLFSDVRTALKSATDAVKASPLWRRFAPGELGDNPELQIRVLNHRIDAMQAVVEMTKTPGYRAWQEWLRSEIEAETLELLSMPPDQSAQLLQKKGFVMGARVLGLNGPATIMLMGREAEVKRAELNKAAEQKAKATQPPKAQRV